MGLNFLSQNSLGGKPNMAVNQLAIFEDEDGRDAAYTEFHGDFRIFINVHFADERLAIVLSGQFFNDWANHTARAAPFCPKIEDGNTLVVEHFLLEVCICDFKSHFVEFNDFGRKINFG